MATFRSDLQPGGGMSTPQIQRRGGNVVVPNPYGVDMELIAQLFGSGVGPMEGERKLKMRGDMMKPDLGDTMGSKRKAFQGEGQPPSNYAAAEKRLQDMLKGTGGYINAQRNLGDLWRVYHGFS